MVYNVSLCGSEDGEEGETGVEEKERVSDEEALRGHVLRGEERGRTRCAPKNRQSRKGATDKTAEIRT